MRIGLDAAATALGLTADELRTELQAGSTIADVAAAEGVDVQTVIDAMVAEATTRLDEKVAAGDLTQAEADTEAADATTRITESVNNGFPDAVAAQPTATTLPTRRPPTPDTGTHVRHDRHDTTEEGEPQWWR